MSLQVWLPLNGTLENKGLANLNLTTTPTYSDNGKIGSKCLSSQVGWFQIPEMASAKQMTFAYWVRLNEVTSTNWLDTFSWATTNGTSSHRSRQEFYHSTGTSMTTGVWYYNSSNSGFAGIEVGEWNHFVFTIDYENGVSKFYKNGSLLKTTTNVDTNYYVSGTYFLIRGSALNTSINDFRLYDNILSEKEIKEIAKGLVLHLPLNNNGLGNKNLLNDLTLWNKESGVTINWDSNQQMYKMVVNKTNNTSRWGIYQYFTVTPNTTYTLSVEGLKGDHTTSMAVGTAESSIGWPANRYTFKTIKTKGVYTFTSGANDTVGRVYLNLQPTPDTGNKTAWFLHPKLELGDKATPWSPNPADGDYPDYGPGIPQNLLSGTPKRTAPTAYLFAQLNLLENLQAGKTYTLQLWNVNVSHSAKTAEQTSVSVYWGGGDIILLGWYGSTYFTDGHADYLSKTFTVTESHARGNGSANKWLNLYNSIPFASGTLSASVGKWKLEESSTASDYTPARTDAAYKEEGYNNRAIFDQSGYCHNAMNYNITYSSDTPKYNVSSVFNGSNSYVKVNDNYWMADGMHEMTINLWAKATTWPTNGGRLLSCTESGGFNLEAGNTGYWKFPICVYTNEGKTSYTYKYDSNEIKIADLIPNEWNMITLVYDKTGTKTYLNGVLNHTYTNTSYGIKFNTNARLFLGCEAATANPSTPYFNGKESDFRIYATALSEKDVKSLYNNNAYIDSDGKIYGKIR